MILAFFDVFSDVVVVVLGVVVGVVGVVGVAGVFVVVFDVFVVTNLLHNMYYKNRAKILTGKVEFSRKSVPRTASPE